jgi:hypothetical protein
MARRFGELEFVDLTSGVHRLTKLKIDSVDSVDRGAGRGVTVEQVKKFPGWQPPEFYEREKAMLKSDHPHHALNDIVDDLDHGRIGKDAGFLKIQDHFNRHHYSIDRTDPRSGKPIPAASQMQKWLDHAPKGQRANMALKRALNDTHDEKMAALNSLDEAHARQQRELGGAQNDGEYANATKRGVDEYGIPLAVSNGAIRKLYELSHALVARAKRDKVTLPLARAFVEISKTDTGRALLLADAALRGIR